MLPVTLYIHILHTGWMLGLPDLQRLLMRSIIGWLCYIRSKKLTLMVLVGARPTFPARTNFCFYFKNNSIKNIFKKKVFIYIKNPV